jgi:uncharacterized protein YwlG (UPF0340 family)
MDLHRLDTNTSLDLDLGLDTSTSASDYVSKINAVSAYSGVTAVLSGTNIVLTFQAAKHVNGVINVTKTTASLTSATTGYQLVADRENFAMASTAYAQQLRWITPVTLAVVENYTDFFVSRFQDFFVSPS